MTLVALQLKEILRVFLGTADLGVLLGKGGLHGNVFRIKPPMCFSVADAGDVPSRLLAVSLPITRWGTC